MTCEEASDLIPARIDGELPPGDGAALDAHLAGCAACRAAAEAAELQDAALLRAFAPRRERATALAERVALELSRGAAPARAKGRRPRLIPWFGLAGAVAAGIALAVVLRRPANQPVEGAGPAAAEPVAHLTLATGEVFTCPSEREPWRPLSPGGAVGPGGRVRTAGASRCELQLAEGIRVRLDAGTEACFADGRDVRVTSGQLWSALPRDAAIVRVSAGRTTVTAGGTGAGGTGAGGTSAEGELDTQFELLSAADATTVTVLTGAARVSGAGPAATVRGGQSVRVPASPEAFACLPVADPLQATRWQDELLLLKPGDDPEVAARVAQLLARISVERAGAATRPGPVEEDVRARGQAWSAPIACFVCGRGAQAPAEERRTAARLLADLAPGWCVPDLIDLLGDEDGEVRSQAARALVRLTGQDLGWPAGRCAAGRDPAAGAAWKAWWEANKGRYPSRR